MSSHVERAPVKWLPDRKVEHVSSSAAPSIRHGITPGPRAAVAKSPVAARGPVTVKW